MNTAGLASLIAENTGRPVASAVSGATSARQWHGFQWRDEACCDAFSWIWFGFAGILTA
jgi:hypothetical protein